MAAVRSPQLFKRFDIAEQRLCISFNRWSRLDLIRHFFTVISKLGDGVFWYALILSLPIIEGASGAVRSLQFTLTGVVGVLLYKFLKQRFVRERPYISHHEVHMGTAPLDRYSFPSGHTLHAVSFAILFCTYYSGLTLIVAPFAALVAISRMVLGLHYPTDVAVGALLGTGLAISSINLFPA
jgi:undecaprenyl-diphosphatase